MEHFWYSFVINISQLKKIVLFYITETLLIGGIVWSV
jgi:hypothetical protein